MPRRKKNPELAYRHHEFILDSGYDRTDSSATRARVSWSFDILLILYVCFSLLWFAWYFMLIFIVFYFMVCWLVMGSLLRLLKTISCSVSLREYISIELGRKKIWWLFGAVVIACECCKSTIGQFIATTRISNSSEIKFRTLALRTNTLDQFERAVFHLHLVFVETKTDFLCSARQHSGFTEECEKKSKCTIAAVLPQLYNFIQYCNGENARVKLKKTYVNQQTIQWNNNGEIVLFNHDTTYDACN